MKALTILAMLLIVPMIAATTGEGLVGNTVGLSATLLRYEPNPVEPGDAIDVYILLANEGGLSAQDVVIEMLDNYPFKLENPAAASKTIPFLPAQESYVATYRMRADKDADEGTSYLKVRFREKSAVYYEEALLAIDVFSNDAAISVEEISVTPEVVPPGEQATIDLHLKNLADSQLRDVAVSLATTRTVGSTTTSLPYAPIRGSLERRLSEVKADESFTISYDIIIEPGAASDVYEIPLTVTFSDMLGNDFTLSDEIGLIVNAKALVDVYIDNSELYTDKPVGEVTLKFVNRGLSEIKVLTAELQDHDSYTVLGTSNSEYVGNIDSDDYETAVFTLKVSGGELVLPMTIHYLDALNQEYTENIELKTALVSSKETGNGNGSTGYIIVAVIVVIIAFFTIRGIVKKRRRKKRQ